MKQFRFAKEKDTVVVEASNREVAERRARPLIPGAENETLISVPDNDFIKKHTPKKPEEKPAKPQEKQTQDQLIK